MCTCGYIFFFLFHPHAFFSWVLPFIFYHGFISVFLLFLLFFFFSSIFFFFSLTCFNEHRTSCNCPSCIMLMLLVPMTPNEQMLHSPFVWLVLFYNRIMLYGYKLYFTIIHSILHWPCITIYVVRICICCTLRSFYAYGYGICWCYSNDLSNIYTGLILQLLFFHLPASSWFFILSLLRSPFLIVSIALMTTRPQFHVYILLFILNF